jgi:hypothetical protein
MNQTIVGPIRVPTPPPPPPPRSLSPPPPGKHISKPVEIAPTSRAKRKHQFELIIEIPAKRFKPSRYPESVSSSTGAATASSSRNGLISSTKRAKAPPIAQSGIRKPTVPSFRVRLDPKIRDVAVSREFLKAHFGANKLLPFSKPTKRQVDNHGYDHFAFVHEVRTDRALPLS